MDANDVIGKYLIAEVDVPIYKYPNATKIGFVKKGIVVGPVYSWVLENGELFWMFDYTIPGQTPSAYYAPHDPSFWKLSTAPGSGVITVPGTGKSKVPLVYIGLGLVGLYFLTK